LQLEVAYSHFFPEVITSANFKAKSFRVSSSAKEAAMARDQVTNERLSKLLAQLLSLTENKELHWEREIGSAHRYARWKNNLLILGPAAPLAHSKVARYLFITPFDSPACVEINSDDPDLGESLKKLVAAVENASQSEPATDPFAITEDVINRLTS
jgi:hypothetical protein